MNRVFVPQEAARANVMDESSLIVHKVKRPRMWVFSTDFSRVMEWPKQVRHNNQTYHYVANEPMPYSVASSEVAGYALYEIKDYVQHPITHREFGAYMAAISNVMMQKHMSAKQVNDSRDEEIVSLITAYISNSVCADDPLRLDFILSRGWAQINKLDLFTISDHSPEQIKLYEQHTK